MRTRVIAVGILALALAATTIDLGACGDKFLRIGWSPRLSGFESIHPASILVYQSPNPTPKGIAAMREMLTRAGHKSVVFVKNGSPDFARLAASGKFDLVIVHYGDDVDYAQKQLATLSSAPSVLPMLDEDVTKAVAAKAAGEFQCLLREGVMTQYDALEEIDRTMSLRLKTLGAPRR